MKLRYKILIAALSVVLLIVGGLVYAHYHLKGQLEEYKASLRAQGEKLAIADHVPPVLAGVTNGAPAFLSAMAKLPSLDWATSVPAMRLVGPGRARVAWQQARLVEEDVPDVWINFTAEFSDYREGLAELRSAIVDCQALDFQPDYQGGLFRMSFNNLVLIKRAGQWLAGATVFELHEGHPDAAWENLRAACLVVKKYEREPVMISQLVRQAAFHVIFRALWESWQGDQWSETQWREVQAALEGYRPMEAIEPCLRMERALSCQSLEQVRENPALMQQLGVSPFGASATNLIDQARELIDDPKETIRTVGLALGWPHWFSYQEERWSLQLSQTVLQRARQVVAAYAFQSEREKFAQAIKQLDAQAQRLHMLAYFGADSQGSFLRTVAEAECVRQLAVTAIALKRYALKHGSYPANLKQLAPEFLPAAPRDLMDGQPLRYALLPDKSLRLYSIGEDGKDDGGDGSPTNQESRITFLKTKDWVWPQPATPEEVEAFHQKLGKKQGTK